MGLLMEEKALTELKELMHDLYETKIAIENHKKNKDHRKYSITPCMVGKNYGNQDIRFMLYGQQANEWPDGFENSEQYSEEYIKDFVSKNGFEWIIQRDDGTQDNGDSYFLSRSRFWQDAKQIFEFVSSHEVSLNEKWQDSIVSSDTYKIGYLETDADHRNVKGWAAGKQRKLSYKIVMKEIEIMKPTHILFMTNDTDWFFRDLKKQLTPFRKEYSRLIGKINGATVVVMRHPLYTTEDLYLAECKEAFKEAEAL